MEGRRRLAQAKARIAELERLVGQQQADLLFFAKPCGSGTRPAPTAARPPLRGRPNDDRRRAARLSPRRRQRGTAVPIGRRVARRLLSAFRTHPPKRDDADLRDLIQRIALDNRHCGYRTSTQRTQAPESVEIRLKSQSAGDWPHARQSAPSSAPSLGRRSLRELDSASCLLDCQAFRLARTQFRLATSRA